MPGTKISNEDRQRIDGKFIFALCHYLLHIPMQTMCGHLMCRSCFEHLLGYGNFSHRWGTNQMSHCTLVAHKFVSTISQCTCCGAVAWTMMHHWHVIDLDCLINTFYPKSCVVNWTSRILTNSDEYESGSVTVWTSLALQAYKNIQIILVSR